MAPRHRGTTPGGAASPAAATPQQRTTSAASQKGTTPTASQPVRKEKEQREPPASVPATTSSSSGSSIRSGTDAQAIAQNLWNNYVQKTPQRVKLIDAFMAFLVVLGALQFVYCILAGNYPFNAFLAGFGATVGQFVLTASLRMQTNAENKAEFKSISSERAFADFVFGSLLLHFFCVNFIN